ncbi:MAG: response regulator [Deltaproteobacteria bacterium]|nr:response regulator [Deltaproteobacteria bacterium]
MVAKKPLRLLIVEDHVDSAELLAELLVSRGHHVRIAGTASAALARAAEEPFDLVVSDVGLPDASGYELMAKLRDRHALKGIALTGTRTTDAAAASGFVAVLTKPIALRTLEETLETVAARL